MTVTEAQLLSKYKIVVISNNTTASTVRTIPYAEVYSGSNRVMETPAEHMQKAGEDEEKRKV